MSLSQNFLLAKRAPAHRRLELVNEPQTWNMHPKPPYLCLPIAFVSTSLLTIMWIDLALI